MSDECLLVGYQLEMRLIKLYVSDCEIEAIQQDSCVCVLWWFVGVVHVIRSRADGNKCNQ